MGTTMRTASQSEKDAEGTASFTYDSANELTTVTGSRSESYTYDSNGNRTGTGYGTTVMNETIHLTRHRLIPMITPAT